MRVALLSEARAGVLVDPDIYMNCLPAEVGIGVTHACMVFWIYAASVERCESIIDRV